MATSWNAYLKWVLPEVKYVPNDMAIDAVRDAATEFLKVSRFWHELSTPYTIDPNLTPRLTVITLPAQAKFYSILWAAYTFAGSGIEVTEVTPKSPADLDGSYPGWRTSQETKSTPRHYTMLDLTSMRIVPWADASGGTLSIDVAFIPTADSTTCTDELFDQYHKEIALGATGILLMQATQKWANPQLGAAYFKQMMDKGGLASARVDRGYVEAPITTKTEYM